MKALLNIREVLSEVRREESRKNMFGEQTTDYSTENSALAARGTEQVKSDSRQRKGKL